MVVPTKEEVLYALNNENSVEALEVKRKLTDHPLWSAGKYITKCPLCGYETTVTNIHRTCPEAPVTEECSRPVYCFDHETYHFVMKNGEKVWTTHKAVLMYVVVPERTEFSEEWIKEAKKRYAEMEG